MMLVMMFICFLLAQSLPFAQGKQPNIILFFVDDMGYGDAGIYGQTLFSTPNLDKMASEGLLFTDFYAGSTVCAPSRSSLLQGLHQGHARIRDNEAIELEPNDVSMGEVLKFGGYHTAYIGKWGVGRDAPWDDPNKNGFDHFLGYTNNGHAHNCYPPFLIYNGDTISIGNVLFGKWHDTQNPDYGEGIAEVRANYAPFVLRDSAVAFIKRIHNQPGPFFLIYALNIPHANNEGGDKGMEVPGYGEFAGKTWPDQEKGFAQMMRYIDNDVGLFMRLLDSLGIAGQSLLMFTSDNGPHSEGGHDADHFNSNGELRGEKRDLWEGGVRSPAIAWWPGVISPGRTTGHIGYNPDFLPTFAELAGVSRPSNIDGISFAPTLLEQPPQAEHAYLYWEFQNKQSVRMGDWKYVKIEGNEFLANLADDLEESQDIKSTHDSLLTGLRNVAIAASTTPLAVVWNPRKVAIPDWQSTFISKQQKPFTAKGYLMRHFRRSAHKIPDKTGYTVQGKKTQFFNEGLYLETHRPQ